MRKVIITAITLLALPTVGMAANFGSIFGALTTANTVGKGNATFGGSLGLADATSFIGSVNYGVGNNTDARFHLGVFDNTGFDSEIAFGADMKFKLNKNKKAKGGSNIDFAIGPIFEYVKMDINDPLLTSSTKVTQFGVQLLVSSTSNSKSGSSWTPYGRFNIRNESISTEIDLGVLGTVSASSSELAIGVNGGLAYATSPAFTLYGEFQLGGNDGFFFGANFKL
ncbi:MAG: hypothetical protein IIB00_11250 [candidate division Zixibacteria bacterium]|nr:hypothetical protein [candidate division Zixibacteria bacterium]